MKLVEPLFFVILLNSLCVQYQLVNSPIWFLLSRTVPTVPVPGTAPYCLSIEYRYRKYLPTLPCFSKYTT